VLNFTDGYQILLKRSPYYFKRLDLCPQGTGGACIVQLGLVPVVKEKNAAETM